MEKGKDNGIFSCIAKNGNAKSRWVTADETISNAKYLNNKNNYKDKKLVVYKCPHCHHYHLKTNFKKKVLFTTI